MKTAVKNTILVILGLTAGIFAALTIVLLAFLHNTALLIFDVKTLFAYNSYHAPYAFIIAAGCIFIFIFVFVCILYGRFQILIALCAAAASVFTFTICAMDQQVIVEDYDWDGDALIAHALGGINDDAYTCSYEAFDQAYANGFTTYEVDLSLTSDERLVLAHDWPTWCTDSKGLNNTAYEPTHDEFMSTKIKGLYSPMDFEGLIRLMIEHPEIYIVTDTKSSDPEITAEQFNYIIDTIVKYGSRDLLDRFIIQVYNPETFEAVDTIHQFENYILTLYLCWNGNLTELYSLMSWASTNEITDVTMWYYLYNDDVRALAEKYGMDVYLHTENDAELAAEFYANGVRGLYTDFLTPAG